MAGSYRQRCGLLRKLGGECREMNSSMLWCTGSFWKPLLRSVKQPRRAVSKRQQRLELSTMCQGLTIPVRRDHFSRILTPLKKGPEQHCISQFCDRRRDCFVTHSIHSRAFTVFQDGARSKRSIASDASITLQPQHTIATKTEITITGRAKVDIETVRQ